MAQSNISEKKRKQQKKDKKKQFNPAVNAPARISRDQRRKEKYSGKVTEEPVPEKSGRKFAINAVMLKCLLLMVTAVGVAGIVFFDPDSKERQVFRGIGVMGVPLLVFLTAEAYYRTSSRLKYFVRLFICALLAQLPMHLLASYDNARNAALRENFTTLSETDQFAYLLKWREFPMLNYLFTALFALLLIWVLDLTFRRFHSERTNLSWKFFFGVLMVFILVLGIIVSAVLQTVKIIESPILTVMLVYAFVILRSKPDLLSLVAGIIGLTFGAVAGPDEGKVFYACGACLPAVLFKFYKGKLGYDKVNRPQFKYAFYLIYVTVLATLLVVGMYVYIKEHGGTV